MLYAPTGAVNHVLRVVAQAPRLAQASLHFSAACNEKTDRERERFVGSWGSATWRDGILQGTHLFVAAPFYKGPKRTLLHHRDWTVVDLEQLPTDARPITSYKPAGDRAVHDGEYTPLGARRGVVPARHYRVAWRSMAANTGERTLISALIPPGPAHVHALM